MQTISYFTPWRTELFACPACRWKGRGSELSMDVFDELTELSCPSIECDTIITGIPHPAVECDITTQTGRRSPS
jgi:hypothetical protein